MFKFLVTGVVFIQSLVAQAVCVPAKEYVEVKHNGQYHRIHPSGNYFLYTDRGSAKIVDITDRKNPKIIETPMQVETYPVESATGKWDLMASPVNGGGRGATGGMDFYKFNDMIGENPKSAKAAYTDKQFGEWYHSTAELPTTTKENKHVRMLLYTNRKFKDYDMKIDSSGAVESTTTLKTGELCDNIFVANKKTPEMRQSYQNSMNEINVLNNERYKVSTDKEKLDEINKKIMNIKTAAETAYYGKEYVDNINKQESIRAEITDLNKKIEIEFKEVNFKLTEARNAFNTINRQHDFTLSEEYKKRIAELVAAHSLALNDTSLTSEVRFAKMAEISKEYDAYNTSARARSNSNAPPEVQTARENVQAAEKNVYELDKNSVLMKKVKELRTAENELQINSWILKDGKQFANPVLSKDGTYVGGLVGNRIEVYKIKDDGNCDLVGKTDFRGSKVSFSYPEKNKLPKITFTAEASSAEFNRKVIVYDLEKKSTSVVSDDKDTGTYYPGFAKDGRIMYKTSSGVSIVDPNQVGSENSKSCIQIKSSTTINQSPTNKKVSQ